MPTGIRLVIPYLGRLAWTVHLYLRQSALGIHNGEDRTDRVMTPRTLEYACGNTKGLWGIKALLNLLPVRNEGITCRNRVDSLKVGKISGRCTQIVERYRNRDLLV